MLQGGERALRRGEGHRNSRAVEHLLSDPSDHTPKLQQL